MLRWAPETGWWIEIEMRLGSCKVNATIKALLLWSDSLIKGEALAAIISSHTLENFLSEIDSGTAGSEREEVEMYDLVWLRVLITRNS